MSNLFLYLIMSKYLSRVKESKYDMGDSCLILNKVRRITSEELSILDLEFHSKFLLKS